MNIEESVSLMWEKAQQGAFYPEALHDKLSIDEAYQVQIGMLDHCVKAGERQAGWKIGLTADAVRAHFNAKAPVYGYPEVGLYNYGGLLDGEHWGGLAERHPRL